MIKRDVFRFSLLFVLFSFLAIGFTQKVDAAYLGIDTLTRETVTLNFGESYTISNKVYSYGNQYTKSWLKIKTADNAPSVMGIRSKSIKDETVTHLKNAIGQDQENAFNSYDHTTYENNNYYQQQAIFAGTQAGTKEYSLINLTPYPVTYHIGLSTGWYVTIWPETQTLSDINFSLPY